MLDYGTKVETSEAPKMPKERVDAQFLTTLDNILKFIVAIHGIFGVDMKISF